MFVNNVDLDDIFADEQYKEYLNGHINNVQKGFDWLCENLPDVVDALNNRDAIQAIVAVHDQSKYSAEEYSAYARYFNTRKTKEVKLAFDYAWNHHQKSNPHHWQYWVLINDEDGTYALDMPYEYIVEMICDWWAFSWKANNLYEIFNWYDNNKDKITLSDKTKSTVENILKKIRNKLEEN